MLTATFRTTVLSLLFIFFNLLSFAQPGNDNCASAQLLTSYTTDNFTNGTVLNSTNSGIAANTCGGTPDDDVWYYFIAQSNNTTINLSNIQNGGPASLAKNDAVLEIFESNGDCSSLNFISCTSVNNATNISIVSTSLIISKRYYVRVFSKSNSFPSSNAGFQISVKHIAPPPPPSNDECAGATTITSNTTCTNTSSTLISSTKSFSTVTG